MNLLILDEPTNHLDITREALESALEDLTAQSSPCRDRYFMKLATRILISVPGRFIRLSRRLRNTASIKTSIFRLLISAAPKLFPLEGVSFGKAKAV